MTRVARDRRRFTAREEPFTCLACGEPVAPLDGTTFRDHCPRCLWGRHVDELPGDRAADCGGALEPVGLVGGEDARQIVYRCRECGALRRNRTAPDDHADALLELARLAAPVPDKPARRRRGQ